MFSLWCFNQHHSNGIFDGKEEMNLIIDQKERVMYSVNWILQLKSYRDPCICMLYFPSKTEALCDFSRNLDLAMLLLLSVLNSQKKMLDIKLNTCQEDLSAPWDRPGEETNLWTIVAAFLSLYWFIPPPQRLFIPSWGQLLIFFYRHIGWKLVSFLMEALLSFLLKQISHSYSKFCMFEWNGFQMTCYSIYMRNCFLM